MSLPLSEAAVLFNDSLREEAPDSEEKNALPELHKDSVSGSLSSISPDSQLTGKNRKVLHEKKADSLQARNKGTSADTLKNKGSVIAIGDKKDSLSAMQPVHLEDSTKADSVPVAAGSANTIRQVFDQGSKLQGKVLQRPNPDWILGMLIGVLVVIAWMRAFYAKTLRQMFSAIFNASLGTRSIREESMLLNKVSLVVTIAFFVCAGLFLYTISFGFSGFDNLPQGFPRFGLFTLAVTMIYLSKYLLISVTGFVFNTSKPLTAYLFYVFQINNLMGIILLPLLIGIYYLPEAFRSFLISLVFLIFIISFIFRIFRGISIGLGSPGFSIFYLFLYLCTLEIAPLLIISRLLSM